MESKGNTNTKTNKMKRKEILEKKKAMDELIKVASAEKDHLTAFHAFRHYQKNGLSACLESGTGDNLTSSLKQNIQNLLKANMEGPYGIEWSVEEKVKRREMVASEARYIFVYEALYANESELLAVSEQERSMLGFVHFRFVIEEDLPVLYVYELQLEPRAQGKGLGKFLMQLVELIARKNQMGAVVLTVQKANLVAMKFYTSKMRYVISAISPSKVDPWLGTQNIYEILCKSFTNDAKAILEGSIFLSLLPCSSRSGTDTVTVNIFKRARDLVRKDRNEDPNSSIYGAGQVYVNQINRKSVKQR